MDFEIKKTKFNFKGILCGVLAFVLALSCLQPSFNTVAAYSVENISGFNVTSGNVTGGSVTGGNVTDGNVKGVYLKLNDDCSSYYVSGVSSSVRNVVIPSTYKGLPVTKIGNYAMIGSDIVSVIIPDSITSIGDFAFAFCDYLEKVFAPESVVDVGEQILYGYSGTNIYGYNGSYIEEYADENGYWFVPVFKYNNNATYTPITKNKIELTEYLGGESDVSIPSEVDGYSVYAIADGAFYRNSSINSVILPESVVKVGEYAFSSCENLESVVFASGTKTIGSYAFSGCENLSKVILPSTIQKLEAYTFNNCQSLTEIIIPESVTEIDLYAFYNCVSLETIYGQIGSYAEEFANENGYTFIDVSGKIVDVKTSSVKIIENSNGYYDTDNNGNEFFSYYDDFIYSDIEYTVEYGSGEAEAVGYWELESLLGNSIEILTNQYDTPFELGKNKIKMKAGNHIFYVSLEIIENPIESIEISDISIIEGTSGYFTTDYDEDGNETEKYYYYSFFNVPFTAKLKDGSVVSGRDGIYIYDVYYSLSINSVQTFNNPWKVGTHTATGEIFGVEDEFSIIITESPVESIICQDISITEFTNGYYSYYYDDGNGFDYYRYDAPVDCEIILKNGTVVQCNEDGRYEYNGEYYYLEIEDSQTGISPWIKGNSYPVTAYAMGASDAYNVTITETNIKSIDVSISKPFYEGLTYDLYCNEYSLFITYKDGTTETLYYSSPEELYIDDIKITELEEDSWSVGTHKASLQYQAIIVEFDYQVVESSFERIEISGEDGLTLILHKTDGTTVKTNPHYFDARGGGPGGVVLGYIYTDVGVFRAVLRFDNDGCSNFELIIGDMYSNVLEKNNWWRALSFSNNFSDIVENFCPSLNDYSGSITAQNIDDIVKSCVVHLNIPLETTIIDSKYQNIVDGEKVRRGISKIYGIENVDLSLSKLYLADSDEIIISGDWGCGYYPIPAEISCSDNVWTYNWVGNTTEFKLELDDELKVKTICFNSVLFDVINTENTTVDDENNLIFTSNCSSLDNIISLNNGYSAKVIYSHTSTSAQLIGTGTIIEFYNDAGDLVDTYTAVVVGDLNGDSVCDVLDASACALYANELKSPTVIEAYAANGRVDNTIDVNAYQNVVNMCVN